MGKMIKVVAKQNAPQLRHKVQGKKDWHFEGEGPFEVSQADYDAVLKPWFDIYKPSPVSGKPKGGQDE
jgi:hypothetical protein